jgi:hypothetical protein
MNDNWNDFEKWMFTSVIEMRDDISRLKEHSKTWGAMAGIVSGVLTGCIATIIAELIVKKT